MYNVLGELTVFSRYIWYTVPKDSNNFVTNNYGAVRLFSATEVFVLDSCYQYRNLQIRWDSVCSLAQENDRGC
jgi:hypothetical protein